MCARVSVSVDMGGCLHLPCLRWRKTEEVEEQRLALAPPAPLP